MRKRRSRLRRILADGYGYGIGADFGVGAVPVFFGNPEEKVDDRDEINRITYGPGPSISGAPSWEFEHDLNLPEWHLRNTMDI